MSNDNNTEEVKPSLSDAELTGKHVVSDNIYSSIATLHPILPKQLKCSMLTTHEVEALLSLTSYLKPTNLRATMTKSVVSSNSSGSIINISKRDKVYVHFKEKDLLFVKTKKGVCGFIPCNSCIFKCVDDTIELQLNGYTSYANMHRNMKSKLPQSKSKKGAYNDYTSNDSVLSPDEEYKSREILSDSALYTPKLPRNKNKEDRLNNNYIVEEMGSLKKRQSADKKTYQSTGCILEGGKERKSFRLREREVHSDHSILSTDDDERSLYNKAKKRQQSYSADTILSSDNDEVVDIPIENGIDRSNSLLSSFTPKVFRKNKNNEGMERSGSSASRMSSLGRNIFRPNTRNKSKLLSSASDISDASSLFISRRPSDTKENNESLKNNYFPRLPVKDRKLKSSNENSRRPKTDGKKSNDKKRYDWHSKLLKDELTSDGTDNDIIPIENDLKQAESPTNVDSAESEIDGTETLKERPAQLDLQKEPVTKPRSVLKHRTGTKDYIVGLKDYHKGQNSINNLGTPGSNRKFRTPLNSNLKESQFKSEHDLVKQVDDISTMMACGNFFAQENSDLGVVTGQKVQVLKKADLDWWWCRSNDGKVGFVPSNFLVEIPKVPLRKPNLLKNIKASSMFELEKNFVEVEREIEGYFSNDSKRVSFRIKKKTPDTLRRRKNSNPKRQPIPNGPRDISDITSSNSPKNSPNTKSTHKSNRRDTTSYKTSTLTGTSSSNIRRNNSSANVRMSNKIHSKHTNSVKTSSKNKAEESRNKVRVVQYFDSELLQDATELKNLLHQNGESQNVSWC